MSDDVPKDVEKILESLDNKTCGCTFLGPRGKGQCVCDRTVKHPGEWCNSCKKHWHRYD